MKNDKTNLQTALYSWLGTLALEQKRKLGALLSSPALDVRLPIALQVLQVPNHEYKAG